MPIFDLGTPEIIVILLVVLLLFGGKKLPELARFIGVSIKELKNSMKEPQEKTKNKKS